MLTRRQFYVNGAWVDPHVPCDQTVIDPSTEEPCATISLGSAVDVNHAVQAARRAFHSWSTTDRAERMMYIRKLLALFEENKTEFADLMSMEMGAPQTLARTSQVRVASYQMNCFLEAYESMDFEQPLNGQGGSTYLIQEPIGVCGLITPWNWPLNQIMLKVIPALLTGCTLVLKPSEMSPLNALHFAELIDEIGLPAGVFNLINGDGIGVGEALTSHPDIDLISFTGSTRAGVAVSKAAANTIKRVTLELGGKGANLIFADADKDAVARGTAHCFRNSGQSCNAPTRMLVERPFYEEAIRIAANVAEQTQVASAHEAGDHIGPVASKIQYDKVQGMIEKGIKEGARLVSGGTGRPDGLNRGCFVKPTIFADVKPDMAIAREEIFGPVLCILPFDREEEVIAIANDTDYGLTNYIQSQDKERCRRIARQLRAGNIEVNGQRLGAGSPFGGYKQSGNGREGGRFGLEEFLELKAISDWH